jgi:hypothetical protein
VISEPIIKNVRQLAVDISRFSAPGMGAFSIPTGFAPRLSNCGLECPGKGREILDLVIDDYRPAVIIA